MTRTTVDYPEDDDDGDKKKKKKKKKIGDTSLSVTAETWRVYGKRSCGYGVWISDPHETRTGSGWRVSQSTS
jgi:hypothetical protein